MSWQIYISNVFYLTKIQPTRSHLTKKTFTCVSFAYNLYMSWESFTSLSLMSSA